MSRSAIDEVLEFAKSVAEARDLASQLTSFSQACEETKKRLVVLRTEEVQVKSTVADAQAEAKQLVADAAQKASGIVSEARNRAAKDAQDAERVASDRLGDMQRLVDDLNGQRAELDVEIKDRYVERDILEGRVAELTTKLDKIRKSLDV